MTGLRARRHRAATVTLRRSFRPEFMPAFGERLSTGVTTFILAVTLPFFGQIFHYLNEFPIPYFLSKAWPILCLPLTLFALLHLRLPGRLVYLVFLAYALGVTPFVSMIYLGNGLMDALMTTVKVWPLTYYFALSSLLFWLAPSYERLRAVIIAMGVATFAALLLMWIFVPTSWYMNNTLEGKLFIWSVERGYRIYLQMFFGVLLLIYLTRSFVQRPRWLPAVLIVIGFVLMLSIYKQRTAIASVLLVCGYAAVASLPPRWRLSAGALSLIAAMLAVAYLAVGHFDEITESLGGSVTVRQTSLTLAANFLGDDLWRWAFGVGATTRFGSVTLADIFGNGDFYVADLGWYGIVFEYGLIGALLLAAVYGWGFYCLRKATRGIDDPLLRALPDYVLYLFVASSVYSLLFTPGELGVVMALGVYLSRIRKEQTAPVPPRAAHRVSFAVRRELKGI